MKHALFAVLLVAATLAAIPCHAQKIAAVNTREVLVKCDEGAKAVAEIRAAFAPRQESMAALKKEIDALSGQQGTKALDKGPQKTELENKVKKFAQDEAQFRKDLAAEEEKRLKPVAEKVSAAIRAYGQEKGLTGVQERGLYLYLDPSLDITDEIVKRVNQAK